LSVRRALVAVLLGLTLAACGSPAPAPKQEYDVAAEAMKAFDRGDWVAAARLLREALVKQPTDLRLHYSLAVAATHLELREEAIREFRWVLANAPAGSPEAEAARNWLIAAGVLSSPTATASSSDAADGSEDPPGTAADPDRGDSTVRGNVSWSDGEPPVKLTRLQLFLKGVRGTPNQEFHMVVRTGEDGRYAFKRVPAGTYKITDRIAGEAHWRLRVSVAAGQDVTQDLTSQNTVHTRDDFPADGK
jgi:hypothetical protein